MTDAQTRARALAEEAITHDSTCAQNQDEAFCDCGYDDAVERHTQRILAHEAAIWEQAARDAAAYWHSDPAWDSEKLAALFTAKAAALRAQRGDHVE